MTIADWQAAQGVRGTWDKAVLFLSLCTRCTSFIPTGNRDPTKNNLGRPEGFQTKLQLKKGFHLTVELTCCGLGWRVEEGENEAGSKGERNKKIEKATVWINPPFSYSLKGNNYESSWKLLGLELKAKSIAPIWFLFVLPWTAIGWPADGVFVVAGGLLFY